MPAYEYECKGCGSHFERRQKMSDPEIDSCPDCGGAVNRLISGGAGAITKGGSGHQEESHTCGFAGTCCGGACKTGQSCAD